MFALGILYVLLLLQQISSFCIQDTCGLPCHCKNEKLCENTNGTIDCECQSGSLVDWSGPACQRGNIAAYKNYTIYDDDMNRVPQSELKCTDDVLAYDNYCTIKQQGKMYILFDGEVHVVFKVTVYNVTSSLLIKPLWRYSHHRTQSINGNQEIDVAPIKTREIVIINDSKNDIRTSEVVIEGHRDVTYITKEIQTFRHGTSINKAEDSHASVTEQFVLISVFVVGTMLLVLLLILSVWCKTKKT